MNLNNSTTLEHLKDLAQTPPEFFIATQNHFRLRFELDVCALSSTAKVPVYYSLAEHGANGLLLPWSRMNWCNPPYSDMMPWVDKAIVEAGKGNSSWLLIPDKPETGITQRCKDMGDSVYHMRHRLNFIKPDGTPFLTEEGKKQGPKFPVMLVAFTPMGLVSSTRDEYIDFRQQMKEIRG